jgi:hypothetical protein
VKKDYFAKLYTFFGLVVLAMVILSLSMVSNKVEDARILGVHTTPTVKPTALPTIKPTATAIPTAKPIYFEGCKSDGTAVSNSSQCCSQKAVYLWSSYVCGDIKPSASATTIPKQNQITPTVVFTKTTLTPTTKQTDCKAGILDVNCIDSNGRQCKWYRNVDCSWTCNQNCQNEKRCEAKKLDKSCVNSLGQSCFEYQNSDCTVNCNQNCQDKKTFGENNLTLKNINMALNRAKIGWCTVGNDYNGDGVVNSLDIVFCKNNSSQFSKNINSFVNRINEEIPKWIDWVVTKMGGN